MFKHTIGAFCALTLCACSGNKSQESQSSTINGPEASKYPITIPFESAVSHERNLKLSEIADSVRYIPLETTDASLIRRIKTGQIIKTSKYWLLPFLDVLFQFDNNGKFIRKVGAKGGGPGEFTWITDIDANEKSNRIFITATDRKINVYELETGKFLYDMQLPKFDSQACRMIDDSTSAHYFPNATGKTREQIMIVNAKGDTLKVCNRYDTFDLGNGMSWMISSDNDRYLFRYGDQLCYKEYYNDTLYTVTTEGIRPRYIFDLGKYALPVECRFEACNGDRNRFQSEAAPYIRQQAIESEHYLFMPYHHWAGDMNSYMLVYDKNKKESFSIPKGFIENDFGGLPFQPVTAAAPNILVAYWDAEQIYQYAEEESKPVLQHPQLKELKEEDNPVLMVVYLK